MSHHLDIKSLRYFCAVAQHGSYTQAAVFLRVTQPVITRQVQAIERGYGVRLFVRSGRKMALTPAGEALLAHAQDILERFDSTESVLKAAQAEPFGDVMIGIPLSLGATALTNAFGRFHRKYPRVTVRATVGNSTEFAHTLAEGRLDIALVFGRPAERQLDFQPLARIRLGLVGPAVQADADPLHGAQTIALREAAALPLILPTAGHALRVFIESSCRHIGVTPRVVFESDGPAVSKELAAQGHGYAVLGLPSVAKDVREGRFRFVEIATDLAPWYLNVATRRGTQRSPAVDLMVKEILLAARDGEQEGTPL